MKELIEKMNLHFDNINQERFNEQWVEILENSCSNDLNIDELIEHQKSFRYNASIKIPNKTKFNFDILIKNPSFTSDFLFHKYDTCSIYL